VGIASWDSGDATVRGAATSSWGGTETAAVSATCALRHINAKIKRIVYEQTYPNEDSLKMLKQAGIPIEQINKKY
jgi:hypothetical protein